MTDLERAEGETLTLVRELALRSTVPWLLSAASGVKGSGLGALVAQVKADPASSLLNLNRLEDEDLRDVLRDLLGDHRLPEDAIVEVLRHSLGNPGLLQSLLELAQQDGSLRWERGRWSLAPGRHLPFRAESDLAQQVFLGRLHRLHPATAALVRLLALADRSMPVTTLGAALGLAGDPLEDALEGAVSSKLVQVQGGEAIVPDPRWRDLIRESTPRPESRRMAKSLLMALPEGPLRTALSVPLQTLAADDATALAELLKALERDPVASPREAQRVVAQALALRPGPMERARLQEWLADAWAHGAGRGIQDDSTPEAHPASQALEALDRALEALRSLPASSERSVVEARLLRKKALLQLHSRRLSEARQTLAAAIDLLSGEPTHPERLRLRTVEGKLQLLDGRTTEGVQSLEEGLKLMAAGKYPVPDQVGMHLELGRALGQQSQFHRAFQHLQSAQRLLQMESDHRAQVPVQLALGQLAMTQGADCLPVLQEALQTARYEGDLALQAQTHLALGVARSVLEQMGPALAHLERAVDRLHRLGDGPQATLAQLWRARTLAALGDTLAAEHLQLKALSSPSSAKLTALEAGDQAFLQAEVAGYRAAWRDAARLYGEAALHFASADLSWRERLSGLRTLQSEAREARQAGKEASEAAWNKLELLKALVDGSGSRWLDLEWQRAHALLLSTATPSDAVDLQTLQTWGGALGLARQLQRPGLTLEACVEGAALLLRRGEKLGAMARLQDSTPAFQQLWSRVPETHEQPFLGREDIHRYRELMTMAGLRFVLPERGDPLADWEPTQANLPPLDPVRTP
jgi:tetratricopeptide (TPR) repeat protein